MTTTQIHIFDNTGREVDYQEVLNDMFDNGDCATTFYNKTMGHGIMLPMTILAMPVTVRRLTSDLFTKIT